MHHLLGSIKGPKAVLYELILQNKTENFCISLFLYYLYIYLFLLSIIYFYIFICIYMSEIIPIIDSNFPRSWVLPIKWIIISKSSRHKT